MGQVSGTTPGGPIDPSQRTDGPEQTSNIRTIQEIKPGLERPTGLIENLQRYSPQDLEGIKSIKEA